ncbi:hypothetical protein ACJRO7_031276 [Eucalyptus globulus]|uniref:Uncharacterized protein n=1 Tax=Eucalyptus globulus TaxID=34317 RepID=A0ABD3JI81_EUCGL
MPGGVQWWRRKASREPYYFSHSWRIKGLSARLLEVRQIGYSIPRNESDGLVTRQLVAVSLRLVMVEEESRVYREKKKETRPIFGDKDIQKRYVDNLLNYLKENRLMNRLKSYGIST